MSEDWRIMIASACLHLHTCPTHEQMPVHCVKTQLSAALSPLAHWFFALWIVLQARAITRTNRIIDAVNRCCYPFEMLGRAVVEVLVPVSLNIWQLCCSMEAFILWSRLSSVPVPFGLFRCANGHLISQVRPTCPRLIILCLVYSLHQVIHHCYWRFLVQQ